MEIVSFMAETATPVDFTQGFSIITSAVTQVFTMITGNPLLMVFVGASLLGLGIGIFRRLKR